MVTRKSTPELFLLKLILGNTYPIHNHDLDITISLPTFYLSFLIGRVPEVESRKLTLAASSVLIRRTEASSLSAPPQRRLRVTTAQSSSPLWASCSRVMTSSVPPSFFDGALWLHQRAHSLSPSRSWTGPRATPVAWPRPSILYWNRCSPHWSGRLLPCSATWGANPISALKSPRCSVHANCMSNTQRGNFVVRSLVTRWRFPRLSVPVERQNFLELPRRGGKATIDAKVPSSSSDAIAR